MVNKKFCDDCQLEIPTKDHWVIHVTHERLNTTQKWKHLCNTCHNRYKWIQ